MKHNRRLSISLVFILVACAPLAAQEERHAHFDLNPIVHEPVLLFQVSGGFQPGGDLTLLTVYDDGSTILVRGGNNAASKVCEVTVSDRANTLVHALIQAGALRLRDHVSPPAADVPQSTVTLLVNERNSGQAFANTFSYTNPDAAYKDVADAITSFLSSVFPTC